jgi:pimeloyl-ACP methyl ester carboxylesterase
VAALVAVDGLLRRPKLTAEQIEGFIGPFRAPTYREHAARFVDAMFPNPGTEALRDRIREEMLQTPHFVMVSALDGMFNPANPDWNLHRVAVPVFAIMARNPMWTAEYEASARSLSAESDYRVIEGAGHFIAQEKPAEFNATLTEMLRKHDLIAK